MRISERELRVSHVAVEIDRPYLDVKKDLESRVNKLDEKIRALLAAERIDELKEALANAAAPWGLLIHYTAIHGDWLMLKGRRGNTTAYLIGNVLSAVEMTHETYAAGLYAPLRVILYENERGGSTFEYDKPTTLFGQFNIAAIDNMAASLDLRLSNLLTSLSHRD